MPRQLANATRRHCPRGQPRQMVLEELPAIDARWLARKKLFPRDYSTRRYSFDFVNPAIRAIALSPRCAEITLATGQVQMIPVIWLPIRGVRQSARPAFQCPGCGRNAFRLFHHFGRFSGCYRCIGVPYASQLQTSGGRSRLQAARLKVFLGQLPDSAGVPARPPQMRHWTYARLVARLRRLETDRPRKREIARWGHRLWRPIAAYDTERHPLD